MDTTERRDRFAAARDAEARKVMAREVASAAGRPLTESEVARLVGLATRQPCLLGDLAEVLQPGARVLPQADRDEVIATAGVVRTAVRRIAAIQAAAARH